MPRYSKSFSTSKGQLAVQRRHGGHGDVVQQQRVAIRRGAGHPGRADGTASPGGVVDDDRRAAQGLAQRLGEVARDAVGRSARGEGHDDGDRAALLRKFLGERGRGDAGRGQRRGDPFLHGFSLVSNAGFSAAA
jgi:hypothetical protein